MQRTKAFYLIITMSVLAFIACHKNTSPDQQNTAKNPLRIIGLRLGIEDNRLSAIQTTFKQSDRILLEYDVTGITAVKENNQRTFWLRQDLMVKDRLGAIVFSKPGIIDIRENINKKPPTFINDFSVSHIENILPGKYRITVLLTDLIAFSTTSETLEFYLE